MEEHDWRWVLVFDAVLIVLTLAVLVVWYGVTGQAFWQFLASAIKIVVSIPLLFFLPGWFLLRTRAGGRLDVDLIERVMLMMLSSVGMASVVMLICAEAGFLRLWFVDIVLIVIAFAIRGIGGHHSRPVPRPGIPVLPFALMLVLVVISSIFFFTPHRWVTGDGDPGINFNVASIVAKTGDIRIKDAGLAAMDPTERDLLAKGATFIGFNVKDGITGTITTRLYHMLPAWLATFMKLFGVMGGLYLIPLFALFNVLLLFSIGRRLAGSFGGFAAALLLAVSSIFIWFSRMPDSELLLQFFLFGSILVLILHFDHKDKMYSLLVGIIFGAALFTKVETLLYLAPFYLLFLVAMLAGKYDKRDKQVVMAVFAASVIALLYNWYYIPDTFLVLVRSSLKWAPGRNVIFLLIGGLAVVTVFFELDLVRRSLSWFGSLVRSLLGRVSLGRVHWLRLFAGLALFAWFLYLYSVPGNKPIFTSTSTNILKLSWMTGGAFLLVAVAAFCVMLYSLDSRVSMLMFSAVVMTVILFMLRYVGSGIAPWETRRYVTLFIPLMVLGVGFVAAQLLRQKYWIAKGVAIAIVVLMIISFIPMDKVILRNTQYAGAEESLAAAAQDAPAGTVALTDTSLANIAGIPLRYRFGKDFLWLEPRQYKPAALQSVVAERQKDGRPISLAGTYDSVYYMAPSVGFVKTGKSLNISFTSLKSSNQVKPSFWGTGQFRLNYLTLEPGKAIPAVPGNKFTVNVSTDPAHVPGYLYGFLYQETPKGTVFWVKGYNQEVLDKLSRRDPEVLTWLKTGVGISRVKIPIPKSSHDIRVQVDIWSPTKRSAVYVVANGNLLPASSSSVQGQSISNTYLITPPFQQDVYQEIVLAAPIAPERGGTANYPMSALSFGMVEATVMSSP